MVRETADRRPEVGLLPGFAEERVSERDRKADVDGSTVARALDPDLVAVHSGAEVAVVLLVNLDPGAWVLPERTPESVEVFGVHVEVVGVVLPLLGHLIEHSFAEGVPEGLDGGERQVHLDLGVVVIALHLDVEPGFLLPECGQGGKGEDQRQRNRRGGTGKGWDVAKSHHVHPNEGDRQAVPVSRLADRAEARGRLGAPVFGPPPGELAGIAAEGRETPIANRENNPAPHHIRNGILGDVTSANARPRRSLLYVPASGERMVAKAATRGADVVVLDLEDGVHPSQKDGARERLRESRAAAAAAGALVALRINPPAGAFGRADLEAAADVGFDAVLLPKAETAEAASEARRILGEATPLWLMIETAIGAAAVFELARLPGVDGLVFGSADYRLSMGAGRRHDESELDFVRQRILLAARAAGVCAWDAPWFAFRELDGLYRSARRAAESGFDGKSAVHPLQIPVIHQAFEPTPAERAWAERVVRTMEDAGARGLAVVELDGELLEELHLRQARRLLAR